ncbi:hypothetical protein PUNSTDRAFT_138002 [Punctularia strigosozonata HHB-11173 SS5]|uniref:Tyr recombinase domain-containing protein n=1 Tax=Punctularia strigosozonata (strain HHB-11173) TaxID=741275 RepID=R7S4R5_PUNST|nr:uncharacterized protein PUNSTDRAFT_138002 [Punctularia strigosozonata HHB-11173 SS5]EIN04802.1 hypothetical protein PUNSTDRAFT_138002 [Punctularia strigosozonata HHB-11173 SS5]
MAQALAPSTAETYGAGLVAFHAFCDERQIAEEQRTPASATLMLAFLAALAGLYAGSTVANYFYGVRAWHLIHGVTWNMDDAAMQSMLKATVKLTPAASKRKKREPYTEDIIRAIRQQLALDQGFDAAVYACLTVAFYAAVYACLTVAFYACARVGELTVRNRSSFEPGIHAKRTDLGLAEDRNGLRQQTLQLPRTKCAVGGEQIHWGQQDGITDPVAALANHLRINSVGDNEHIFAYTARNGEVWPLTRKAFLDRIRAATRAAGRAPLQGHGIRIGGTLEYLLRGVPFEVVKTKGRWGSEAFLGYLRKHAEILAPYMQARPRLQAEFIRYAMPPVR